MTNKIVWTCTLSGSTVLGRTARFIASLHTVEDAFDTLNADGVLMLSSPIFAGVRPIGEQRRLDHEQS
jgi:hypothetical protein